MKKAKSSVISSTTGKVAFNTAAQSIGKVVHLVAALLRAALVTRALGRAGYGDYSLAQNFMLFLSLGVDFGLNAIVVRAITRKKEKTPRYFANLISLRLLISSIFILLGIGALFVTPYSPLVERGIALALLILFPWGMGTTANAVFQANFRYDFSTMAMVLGQLTSLFLCFWGSLSGQGMLFYLVAGLTGQIFVFLSSFAMLKKFKVGFSLGGDWRLWKSLVLAALPLGMMLLFNQVVSKADLFLLSLLPGPKGFDLAQNETVGVYSLAYQLFKNAIIPATFFMNAFFPVMVEDYKKDRPTFNRRFKKAILVLLGISILGLVIGFVLAPWLIEIIAGREFGHSIIALRILILGLPLFYLSSPLQWYLVTVGKEKVLPFIYGTAALASVALNFIFIPTFSYQASAVIVLVVEGLILSSLTVSSLRVKKAV